MKRWVIIRSLTNLCFYSSALSTPQKTIKTYQTICYLTHISTRSFILVCTKKTIRWCFEIYNISKLISNFFLSFRSKPCQNKSVCDAIHMLLFYFTFYWKCFLSKWIYAYNFVPVMIYKKHWLLKIKNFHILLCGWVPFKTVTFIYDLISS